MCGCVSVCGCRCVHATVARATPGCAWPAASLSRLRLTTPARAPARVQVDLALTQRLMDSPAGAEVKARGIPMVGESGIFTPEDVAFVKQVGRRG